MEKNRVLVISISSWNEKVGSNTWKELLSFLDDSKVGCITFRPGSPEKKYSKDYLIYDETKIVKSIFNKHIIPCYLFNDFPELLSSSKFYKNKHRCVFLKRMAREIAWKLSNWRNKVLDDFIKGFNPTHIVYFMDGYIHANRLCRYAKRITSAKTIGYFVDDTFSFKQRNNVLFYLYRFFQRRSIKKLVKTTDEFWSINDKMKEEVKRIFKIDSTVVTKPMRKVDCLSCRNEITFPLQIMYAGNLEIGRINSLLTLVQALREVNKNTLFFKLDVYSNYQGKKIPHDSFVSFHGPIKQEIVFEKYNRADILLFLESNKHSFAKIARLSFSTKITDYLSYKKPILAIGSKKCFPIMYLFENDATLYGNKKTDLINILMQVINDPHILEPVAENAYRLGIKNHNQEFIKKEVRSFFN